MAGNRELKITVLGDSTSAERALKGVEEGTEKAHSKLSDFAANVGPKLAVGGAAITGIGAKLTQMGEESQIATAQLTTAIENTGESFDQLEPRVNKVSDSLIKLGFDDEDTARALATLTTATQDSGKALESMNLVADIARARHISLESAADKVAKMYAGNTRIFKEFGITVSASATAEEKAAAIAELSARVHGQAAAQADTFGGKMNELRIRAENVAEAIGSKVGPALTILGPVLTLVGAGMQMMAASSAASAAASLGAGGAAATASGGFLALASGIWAAIAPFAIVIAGLAAVGAAAYLLWQNWDTVWGWVTNAAQAAANALGSSLEWITNAVSAAASWIGARVGDIVSFFVGLPNQILGVLSGLAGDLLALGGRLIGSLADGIRGGIGRVLSAAASVVGAVKDKLEFWRSPPEAYGEWLGSRVTKGVATGLSATGAATSAASGLVGDVKGTLAAMSGAGGYANGVGGGIVQLTTVLVLDGKELWRSVERHAVDDLRRRGRNGAGI